MEDKIVKSVEVEKEVYAIWIDNIDLGSIEKSQLRYIIQQLDNIIN